MHYKLNNKIIITLIFNNMKKITSLILASIISATTTFAADFDKVVMVGSYASYEELQANGDDDEKAAAEWFNNYGGKYVSTAEIADGTADLSKYQAIWIAIDRVTTDINTFRSECLGGEKGFLNETVKSAITNFYKNGGNLLLTNHACILLKDFGRIDRDPENVTFAEGVDNQDVIDVNVVFGTWNAEAQAFDYSNDPLYNGITIESVYRPEAEGGREYKVFHMTGPGWKEDHNCFWHFDNAYDGPATGNDDPNHYKELYNLWQVTPLGMWPHIKDYYGGAIARWDANDTYKGKCITIGIACYEWNQNNTKNPYQENIERLTYNALNELAPDGTGAAVETIADDEIVSTTYYTLQGIEVKNPSQNGLYIRKQTTKEGKAIVDKVMLDAQN